MAENIGSQTRYVHNANRSAVGDSAIMPRVINPLPMPAGAAVPVRAPQSQRVPPVEPAQPVAAQAG
jgi:hypothetical protein